MNEGIKMRKFPYWFQGFIKTRCHLSQTNQTSLYHAMKTLEGRDKGLLERAFSIHFIDLSGMKALMFPVKDELQDNFTHFVFVGNSVSEHVFLHEIAHALLGHRVNYRIRKTRDDRIRYVQQELEAEGNAIFWQYGKQSKQFEQFVKKNKIKSTSKT